MTRVGLLLSGCGRYDGTEIDEAVLSLLALDRINVRTEFLAPLGARAEAVDHATGQLTEGDYRSVFTESARIARGKIVPVAEVRHSLLSALVVPGGQGVARSLMQGAGEAGRKREADPEVADLVRRLIEQKKPIGAVSLAGSLIATILGLPLEEDPFSLSPSEIRVDEEHGIVWTPGYLAGDRIAEISKGIDRMVEEVMRRAANPLAVMK